MSVEPFRRLVKIVARAFYDDEIPVKGAAPGQAAKADNNKGLAVVVLDALTRRQWVKEEELAKNLKLHAKQVRRALRVLEEDSLVLREDRKETVKGAKAYNAAVAASGDVQPGNENDKPKLHSYWCLDYGKVCDVMRYRLLRVRKMIKDQLEDRNTVQQYVCPDTSCGRRYTALDAANLINPVDMNFHCERCNAELVAESDKLAVADAGDGDSEATARRRQREKLREMLERAEAQWKALQEQLHKLKELTPPDYGSFEEWQKRALATAKAQEDGKDHKSGQGEQSRVPLPFVGETKVEVSLDSKKDVKEDAGPALKVLPPWMIREGMSLTASQRGEVKQDPGAGDSKLPDRKPSEDTKTTPQDALQEEYLKAYYAAYMQQQQPEAAAAAAAEAVSEEPSAERQIGEKSKRPEDDEEIEWEEDGAAANGGASQAGTAAPASDDEIDWE